MERPIRAHIIRVIATSDNRYDLYVRLYEANKSYILYLPRLARKPDDIDLSVERDKIILKILSKGEGFCSCTLDLSKISRGCLMISCVSPAGVWVAEEEILKSHKVEEEST
ncbi:MAG: hypothetical protein ABWJ42_02655 [Sulfolobales archaeon]